jgi:hypothetical protein
LIISKAPLAAFQIPNQSESAPIENALRWARGLSSADREAIHELVRHVCDSSQSDQIVMAYRSIVQDDDLESLSKIRIAISERAFPYESIRQEGWGFFCKTGIRINHSCRPNAEAYSDKTKERLCVRAVRVIEKDEEITLSYINENCKRQKRWERLRIECKCAECCLSGEEFAHSENDRAELQAFYITMSRLRARHNMDRRDIFTMTDVAAHAISKDPDTMTFLEMQKNLAKRPLPTSMYLALACDTIAIILLTGSENDRWAYIDGTLMFLIDELDILKIISGIDHERTTTLVAQVENLNREIEARTCRTL